MEDCAQENSENNADSQLFTESVQFCVDYLKSNNYIFDQNVNIISDQSKSIGLDLANLIVNYMESLQKVESDELFILNEESAEGIEVNIQCAEVSEVNNQCMEVDPVNTEDLNPDQTKNTPELSESSSGKYN